MSNQEQVEAHDESIAVTSDDEEEEKQYGMSTAKLAGATLSANQIVKDKAKEMANEVKKI